MYQCLTSFLSSSCGQWFDRMSSSLSVSLPSCQRIECLTETISSIFSTLSSPTTYVCSSSTQTSSGTLQTTLLSPKNLSRSLTTGFITSTLCPSSHVSLLDRRQFFIFDDPKEALKRILLATFCLGKTLFSLLILILNIFAMNTNF